jgi:hypothetical protein
VPTRLIIPANGTTVKAANFGPHVNFDLSLQVLYLLWMNHVPKMNIIEFVDLKVFYNFYSLLFSVGRVSMIASPSEKESKVSMRSKFRGFDGIVFNKCEK